MSELANVFRAVIEGLKFLAEIYSWDVPDVIWIAGVVYAFIYAMYLASNHN